MNAIRKFDAAGRIMETDEGALAAVACDRCSRANLQEVCMVFADGRDKACAACKRHAKSGCNASLNARPLSLEERVENLEQQLKAAYERIEELETAQAAGNSRIDNAIEGWKRVVDDIRAMWNSLWPHQPYDGDEDNEGMVE